MSESFQKVITRIILFSLLLILALASFFLVACSSAPEPVQREEEPEKAPPEWVTNPPKDTAEKVYFLGSATNGAGDLPQAEADAVNSLIAEITRYIGVRVSSETTVEAKDTLEEYTQSITESITQTSSARVSDFRVEDKWVNQDSGKVSVHILGSYDRSALEEEKERIAAVFEEQQEAVFGPEREGDALVKEEKYFQAGVNYVEAATAAVKGDLENTDIRFRRNIQKAKDAFSRIHLFKMGDGKETFVADPFDSPFTIKVTKKPDKETEGLKDVPLRLVHKVLAGGGKTGIRSFSMTTDENGIVRYTMPPPEIAGRDRLTVLLDLEGWLEPLYGLPGKYQDDLSGLERIINDKRVVFNYTVVSRAASIPTGILILDVGRAENPMDRSNTAAGISDELSEAGFGFTVLSVSPAELMGKTEDEFLKLVAASGVEVERVIFGVCEIEEFTELDENYLVKVAGSIKVADVESGAILFTDSQFKRSRGSSPMSTISAAFRGLGRGFGEELVLRLP